MENQINFFTVQDIYNHTDKSEPLDITKVYDPLYFWDDYADKYFKEFKKPQDFTRYVPWLLNRLKLLNIETLYNAGCGFCRVEPFLLEGKVVKKVTSADTSTKLLEIAETYLKDRPERQDIEIINQTIKWSNLKPNNYDCVMSVECMQHLHLPTIRYAVKELEKLTKKYVVVIERYLYEGEHPAPHIWSHNYAKLFDTTGLKLLESSLVSNGVIGMILRK